MTCILAIETSQRTGGVAIELPEGALDAEALRPGSGHDDDLVPAIDRLLARHALSARTLQAIAVSIGPGGFTGLRIAVTTAKMLALSLGARIVAVPSALVAAECASAEQTGGGPIIVTLAAKRDACWVTRLERAAGGAWSIAREGALVASEDVDLAGATALLGDQHLPRALRDRCDGMGLAIVEPKFEALACLAVAQRLLAAGVVTDPLHVAPIYARPPEAVSLWEARHEPIRGARRSS